MKASTKAIRVLGTLAIPEGPKAGQLIKLTPFQKQFVRGALADGMNVAVLSIGRENAKAALSAGIASVEPNRQTLFATYGLTSDYITVLCEPTRRMKAWRLIDPKDEGFSE
jgi:hypothetical protein